MGIVFHIRGLRTKRGKGLEKKTDRSLGAKKQKPEKRSETEGFKASTNPSDGNPKESKLQTEVENNEEELGTGERRLFSENYSRSNKEGGVGGDCGLC